MWKNQIAGKITLRSDISNYSKIPNVSFLKSNPLTSDQGFAADIQQFNQIVPVV
jgi:hypothetical protein